MTERSQRVAKFVLKSEIRDTKDIGYTQQTLLALFWKNHSAELLYFAAHRCFGLNELLTGYLALMTQRATLVTAYVVVIAMVVAVLTLYVMVITAYVMVLTTYLMVVKVFQWL